MKKKLFLIVFLLLHNLLYSYSADVIAAWEFEGDKIDVVNGYALIPNGTGGSLINVNPTAKYGTGCYQTAFGQKYDGFPVAPQTSLKNSNTWTIDYWGFYRTKAANGVTCGNVYFSRGPNGTGNFSLYIFDSDNWNPYGQNGWGIWGDTGQFFPLGAFSTTLYTAGTANDWNRQTTTFNNGIYKLYINGALQYTSGAGKANLFANTTDNATFFTSSQWGNDYNSYWAYGMDRIIFATNDSGGVEYTSNSPTETPTPPPTPTLTVTPTPTQTVVISSWVLLNAAAAFPPRGFAGSVVFQNKLWIFGGSTLDNQFGTQYNDVWNSKNGIDWVAVTRNAEWSTRRRVTAYVFLNKLWVVAGVDNAGTYMRDVWSSIDGVFWTQATALAAWGDPAVVGGAGGRIPAVYKGLVFDNKMWVLSGQVQSLGCVNDAWYSSNGVDWYASTRNTQFDSRSGGSGVVHDNKLYISGGASCGGGTTNNVWWSSDGIFWTIAGALDQGHLQHQSMASFLGRLWVLGGSIGNPGADQDYAMWITTAPPWTYEVQGYGTRGAFCSETFKSNIYIFAGYDDEDSTPIPLNSVWRSNLSTPLNELIASYGLIRAVASLKRSNILIRSAGLQP